MDGDGDMDVLSASQGDDKIAWYENLGTFAFSGEQVISSTAEFTQSVSTADLDGDGDLDVLATADLDLVLWFENDGAVASAATISQLAHLPEAAVGGPRRRRRHGRLTASLGDDKVAWYENSAGPSDRR